MSRKAFLIAMGIILAAMAAIMIIAYTAEAEQNWDVCCPMANTHVTWEQTYHSGAWNGD